MSDTTLAEALADLAALEDPKMRAANEKRGGDHDINLFRARALSIGEELQVLADYPTPPGCTSPFAPSWINEIVRRREG